MEKSKENKIVRVEFIKYLHDVKRNQLAWVVSETNIELSDNTKYRVRHGRIVKLRASNLKKAGKLPWGEWEIEGILISHNGERYLRYYRYDGELQETQVTIYDEQGDRIFLGHPAYYEVYDHWQSLRKHSAAVCRNLRVSNIVNLTLLDGKGDPDVDIIYERFEGSKDNT